MPPEICNFTFKIMNSIESQKGEIVMYQPDETIRLEVRVEDETVWLTQQQIADLFQSSRTNVVEHVMHIYEDEELEESSTCRKFRQVRKEGKRMVSRVVPMYNLDMIISVGYRINSKRGVKFRQWANRVLKEYMLNGYSVNRRFETIEQRLTAAEDKIQIFDAYVQIVNLIKQAKRSITLIDNYIDETTLTMLSKRDTKVSATIYTRQLSQQQQLDVQRHNQQYPPIAINTCQHNHDRFLIIDDVAYLFGASLKDAGKKLFAYIQMQETSPADLLSMIR